MIVAEVSTWQPPPEHVWRFGSSVSGRMRLDSDIDLFLVGRTTTPTWDDLNHRLSRLVSDATGNEAQLYDVDVDELAEALAEEPGARQGPDDGSPGVR